MSKYPENRMTSFKGLNTLKAVFVQIWKDVSKYPEKSFD
jgi:hypothetical protein